MARVTLVDLLLLGAPDGKTEIIDGWMERTYAARTAATARTTFVRLSREVARSTGVAWSAKAVAGRSAFRAGRCRLSMEGDLVILGVRVPVAVWEEFAGG